MERLYDRKMFSLKCVYKFCAEMMDVDELALLVHINHRTSNLIERKMINDF